MDATDLLQTLCTTIDERRWEDLPALLHDDFTNRYVHTDETFDGEGWVRANAEYPDFDRMVVEALVGTGDRAVSRCRVTGRDVGVAVPRYAAAELQYDAPAAQDDSAQPRPRRRPRSQVQRSCSRPSKPRSVGR